MGKTLSLQARPAPSARPKQTSSDQRALVAARAASQQASDDEQIRDRVDGEEVRLLDWQHGAAVQRRGEQADGAAVELRADELETAAAREHVAERRRRSGRAGRRCA